MENQTPKWSPKPEIKALGQELAKDLLTSLATPKEWAGHLQLTGEFADRTIRNWANGVRPIPDGRINLIVDTADVFLLRIENLSSRIREYRIKRHGFC